MAVIQISTIQVRRGLQENLPQLASAEIGWSIDRQRMFIGNGTLSEGAPDVGNTEILTANSDISELLATYTFRGEQSGYVSQTGASLNTPVQRSVNEKLDDIISLHDFTTSSDAGDYTEAIQRAIDEIYPEVFFSTRATRRRLYIPAGDYPVSGVITIPPYARITGDGPESTRIIGTGAAMQAVFMLRDSKGQINGDLALLASELPRHNEIRDMTIEQSTDNPCVLLDSSREMHLINVKFRGMHLTPATIGSGSAGVHIISSAGIAGRFADGPSGNIVFRDCYFLQHRIGLLIEGEIVNVAVNESTFETMFQGIVSQETDGNSPQSVKVVNSRFHTIAQQAIVSDNESSTISEFNYFNSTVGYGDGTDVVSATVGSPVITFNTSNNFSIGNMFERTSADIATIPVVDFTELNAPLAAQILKSTFGTLESESGRTVSVVNDTSGTVVAVLAGPQSAIVDYSISRGTENRTGTLSLAQNGVTVDHQDDFAESAVLGTSLDVSVAGSTIEITCDVDDNVNDAVIKYAIRTFI